MQIHSPGKTKLPNHYPSKSNAQGTSGSLSSLGHSSCGQAALAAGAVTCKAQHRSKICLPKRVGTTLAQSHAHPAQKVPKNIFKVAKQQILTSTNTGLSDHRYSLASQQQSQSALKRTNSTDCDLSLQSSTNSRSSVVALPQIQYSQRIKTTSSNQRPAPEPRAQGSR